MTTEEAAEFVKFVDGAWKPELTEVEQEVWRRLCAPLDPKAAFTVLTRLMTTEKFRPSRPDFTAVYRRELMDTRPIAPENLQARDEMPDWVRGWFIAFTEGDRRLWPEQEKGYRELQEWWEEEHPRHAKGEHSGYEWEADVAEYGIMPQADRLDYMERSKVTQEQVLDALMSSTGSESASPPG